MRPLKTARTRTALLGAVIGFILLVGVGFAFYYLLKPGPGRCVTIDLTSHYNHELHIGWLPDFNPQNHLAALPRGRQLFHRIQFDVRGVLQLQGLDVLRLHGNYPEAVTNIHIGERCRQLHILHGTSWPETEGAVIAKLVLHYEGDTEREIEIRYGEQALDWWCSEVKNGSDPSTQIAWAGENPVCKRSHKKLRIFQSKFRNPLSKTPLESVDYVSTVSRSAPFLIALTIEK